MTRKSKQPGGHMPLTASERSKLKGTYGTSTARLSGDSQSNFGDCCLSLEPAIDPVATPSGHVYSREAIVSYLLQKNRELKTLRLKYDARIAEIKSKRQIQDDETKRQSLERFVQTDTGAARISQDVHAESLRRKIDTKIDSQSIEEGKVGLKRTSYWLSEYQPVYGDGTDGKGEVGVPPPPPDRPLSPMSGEPLRLKDLIALDLVREGDGGGGGGDGKGGGKKGSLKREEDYGGGTFSSSAAKEVKGGGGGKVLCSVSGRAITTQRAIVMKKTGKVMLRDVYEALALPTMTCPVTGKKFKEKDVLELRKATSGFAASGDVTAKRYRPTMT